MQSIKTISRFINSSNKTLTQIICLTTSSTNKNGIYSKEVLHKRSEASGGKLADKIEENETHSKFNYTPDQIEKAFNLVSKQIVLAQEAISKKKLEAKIQIDEMKLGIDAAIAYAKSLRVYATNLKNLIEIKDGEEKGSSNDYILDNDGKQTPITYPTVTTIKLNFDKKEMLEKIAEIESKADVLSDKVDEIMSAMDIDIDFKIAHTDNLQTILAKI